VDVCDGKTMQPARYHREMPNVLTEFARAALEWDRFLDLLETYAVSTMGRAWLRALAPSADIAWLEREHSLVQEMRLLLAEGVRPSLAGLSDPTQLLAKARLPGTALEPAEIRTLVAVADAIVAWTAILATPPERIRTQLPGLNELTEPLLQSGLSELTVSIQAKLLPDGTLADTASAELSRIRREIDRQQRVIEDSLRSALRKLAEGGAAQEELITIRGDRFVIPVKAEAKRRVAGIVHGASSSGQTVYVEPLETLELNNELVRLFEAELAEMHQIFLAITAQLGGQAHVLEPGAEVLAVIETLLIRARFAESYDAVRPRFSLGASASLRLTAARHPLLEQRLRASTPGNGGQPGGGNQKVVPLSIALEADERQMVISGPNTGGKTVVLKTAGLLALMAQSGIPVPAFEAMFPVYTALLADIGDAQSIEANLSTFSAHITNLNRIARLAGPSTLVLLDELGSATDPDEGSALAVAIAEHFLHAGAWTVLSTHLTAIKIWAETTKGVVNASVGFNADTLAPTYELRQGVPGASSGIHIAARLGLAPEIVERARSRMTSQTLDIGGFLDRLHTQIAAVGEERVALQAEERALRKERHRLETEGMAEWREQTRELERQLTATLRELETQAKAAVEAIEERSAREKAQVEAERRVARLRREFSEQFTAQVRSRRPNALQTAAAQAATHTLDPSLAGLGDTVRLKIGQQGKITRELDANTLEVAIGSMKMKVRRGEIAQVVLRAREDRGPSPLEGVRKQRNITVHTTRSEDDFHSGVASEINVIGLTADHAGDEVTKYVDQAFLAGLRRVRIVHGTGMGVLRRTLRASLHAHPHVATVTEADQYEGGQGATIVELRQ
jgi:DNA mismatch repair protein MutS2